MEGIGLFYLLIDAGSDVGGRGGIEPTNHTAATVPLLSEVC